MAELLRAEEQLFLLLAGSRFGADAAERAKELIADVSDWSFFERLCDRFGLSHIIGYGLRSLDSQAGVPGRLMDRLNSLFWSSVLRNEIWLFGRELPAILRAFRSRGLKLMLLKGAVMAAMHYERRCLRLFGDLDILVQPERVQEAAEALIGMGYVVPEGARRALPVDLERQKAYPPLVKRGDGGQHVAVDLHWRLSNRLDAHEQSFWACAEVLDFGRDGVSAYVPSLEHRLLHICLHTADHGLSHGIWAGSRMTMQCACDIERLFSGAGERLNWAGYVSLAKEVGIAHHCYSFLKLSHCLFGTPLTGQEEWLIDKESARLSDTDRQRIAAGFLRCPQDEMRWYAFNLLMRKELSWSYRWRAVLRKCFPPVSAVARHYGVSGRSWVAYFYYVRRLFRPSIARGGVRLGLRLVQFGVRRALGRKGRLLLP